MWGLSERSDQYVIKIVCDHARSFEFLCGLSSSQVPLQHFKGDKKGEAVTCIRCNYQFQLRKWLRPNCMAYYLILMCSILTPRKRRYEGQTETFPLSSQGLRFGKISSGLNLRETSSCNSFDLASQSWCGPDARTYGEGTPISCSPFFLDILSSFSYIQLVPRKVLSARGRAWRIQLVQDEAIEYLTSRWSLKT